MGEGRGRGDGREDMLGRVCATRTLTSHGREVEHAEVDKYNFRDFNKIEQTKPWMIK